MFIGGLFRGTWAGGAIAIILAAAGGVDARTPAGALFEGPAAPPEVWFDRAFAIAMLLLAALLVRRIRAIENRRALEDRLRERAEKAAARIHEQRARDYEAKNLQLQRAEELFTAIYESSGIFMARVDRNGVLREVNSAVEHLGFALPDVLGKPYWQGNWWQVSPDVVENIRVRVELALAGEPTRGDSPFVTQSGEERICDLTLAPIRDGAGRVAMVFATGVDITERSRQYQATFENAAVGMAHISTDFRWVRVNEVTCRILGRDAGELIGRPVADSVDPDDREIVLGDIEKVRTGGARETDRRYLYRDGTTVWVRASVSAVRKDEKSISHFVAVLTDVSNDRKAHQLLQRQAALLDQSHDALLTWKVSGGGIVYWSRGAEALYGYTAAEATGRISHELLRTRVSSLTGASIEEIEAGVIRDGSRICELTHTTRDGRQIEVESRLVLAMYDGEPYVLETNRDVTERKRAERQVQELLRDMNRRIEARTAEVQQRSRELAATQQQLHQTNEELLAAYDQGLYAARLDLQGRVVTTNRAALEATGVRREEVLGRPFWDCHWFSLPGSRDWVHRKFDKAVAGQRVRGETGYLLKSGEDRVIDITFFPIRNETGRVTFIFTCGVDTTERARQYQAVFENAAVGIAHLSAGLDWVRVNGALCNILGFGQRELIRHSLLEVVDPEFHGAVAEDVRRLDVGGEESYEAERRYRRKDGSAIWVRSTVSAVRKADGSIDHYVLVMQDISAHKLAEERIHLLMREMNHRGKNMLGLVQAVARQTAASNRGEFIDRFTDRIQALAANQELLARTNWEGVEIDQLVQAQLAHFSNLLGSRITSTGPRLRLTGAAAQAIGMALHELATNASKYGALSTDSGTIDIAWEREHAVFRMSWTERGGPRVQPPTRRGYGSTVIEDMPKRALDGDVQFKYAPEGVTWQLTCPAAQVVETLSRRARAAAELASPA